MIQPHDLLISAAHLAGKILNAECCRVADEETCDCGIGTVARVERFGCMLVEVTGNGVALEIAVEQCETNLEGNFLAALRNRESAASPLPWATST